MDNLGDKLIGTNALEGLDSSFKDDNDGLVESYSNIKWEDITSLNKMVEEVEKVVLKYKSPNLKIKTALDLMMKQLLRRYPLFFGYWKKYTAISYQLFGLEASISVLENAITEFPTSLEIWSDYLNVLCANSPDDVELIKEKFQVAKLQIGYNFMSDSFWDKYIEYETKNAEPEQLFKIYEELITYPLYHYAKYGIAYKELVKSKNLQTSVKDIDRQIKSNQIIVNSIWAYENKIKQNFFNLTTISKDELDNWDNYLEFLIANRKKLDIPLKFVQSVFDRCLVPCYYYEYFWIKYLNFLDSEEFDLKEVTELLGKGIKILPNNLTEFRITYLSFLKKNYKRNKELVFSSYQQAIGHYLNIWPGEIKFMTEYLSFLKNHKFPSSLDQSDKDILMNQTSYTSFLTETVENFLKSKPDNEIFLQKNLTDLTFPIVAVELIRMNWLVLKNMMQTIKLITQFMKLPLLKSSTTFWLTYYKFEKCSKNFNKLNKFISQLGKDIILPTEIIDDLLTDYKTFYLTNSNIINHQSSTSNKRKNNEQSTYSLKIQNQSLHKFGINPNINKIKKSEWFKSKSFKENGHVGISIEKPHITNSILQNQSKSFKNIAPALPIFRNIDKINQPINYNDILSKEYLEKKQ